MADKKSTAVQPVNFHANPDILDAFWEKCVERHITKKDAYNEAIYMWTHLGRDPATLAKLKTITAKTEVGGE